jgi:hypothetical protein
LGVLGQALALIKKSIHSIGGFLAKLGLSKDEQHSHQFSLFTTERAHS